MSEPIPLARPELGAREEELVLQALRSGRLSLGPMQERFERGFADWLGVEDVVAVSSGTAALHLGVRRLGWGAGDQVVTTPFSFVASSNCLLYEGAEPVFADVDPVTLNLDPQATEAAVGERTAGLLPVHIFGYPAQMPELAALAERLGLGVLEDACQAPGAVDADGTRVGARGDLTAFAFYANKQLTTGEGGVIVPRSAEEAAVLRSERNQGRADDMGQPAQQRRTSASVYDLRLASLDHDRLGFNYRMTELQAALGIAQLERADELLASRARVAELYAEALGARGGRPAGEGPAEGLVLPAGDRGAERRSWFVYPVRLPAAADREAVIADLDQRGIAAKAYLPCIHLMPHYRERFGFRAGEFPVAEETAERSLALPFFPGMTGTQVERVAEALAEGLGSRDWT